MEAEFGLRRQEAIEFTPSRDDRGDRIRLEGSTPGGNSDPTMLFGSMPSVRVAVSLTSKRFGRSSVTAAYVGKDGHAPGEMAGSVTVM